MKSDRRFTLIVVLISICMLPLIVSGQAGMRVAIMDFRNLTQESDLDFLEQAVPEILITDLSICDKLVIVERARLETVLQEMQLSLSGNIDESTAAEIGKMLGAESILTGSILGIGNVYRIDSRLINVKTSEVLLAEKKEWQSDSEIITAVDQLAEQIIERLTGDRIEIIEEPDGEPVTFSGSKPLYMETATDNSYWEAGSDNPIYVQIDLFAREISENERIPLNIALVLDRSGSMSSNRKLDYVKRAAAFVVRNLTMDDVLSLVAYQTSVETVIDARRVINKDDFLRRILGLEADGSTNLSGGMLEGYSQVQANARRGQVNRVLLLSDGLANRGIVDQQTLENICREKSAQGISISTFGVGLDYNEDLMLGLGEYGNGNYYYIEVPEDIPAIFSRELRGLLAIGAQNVTICVEIPEGAQIEDSYGYLYQREGNRVILSVGDIYSNEHRKMVLKVRPPRDYGGSSPFADISLLYHDATSGGNQTEEKSSLHVTPTSDRQRIREHHNPTVGAGVALLGSTVSMQKAMRMVDEGKIESARGVLTENVTALGQSPGAARNQELKKQILAIHRYEKSLEGIERMPSTEVSAMQKKEKFMQYQLQKTKDQDEQYFRRDTLSRDNHKLLQKMPATGPQTAPEKQLLETPNYTPNRYYAPSRVGPDESQSIEEESPQPSPEKPAIRTFPVSPAARDSRLEPCEEKTPSSQAKTIEPVKPAPTDAITEPVKKESKPVKKKVLKKAEQKKIETKPLELGVKKEAEAAGEKKVLEKK